jgi:DNA repair photolyase
MGAGDGKTGRDQMPMILRPFDPWNSPLCTCPPKMSLNPYTGCPHGCIYCYASSYIPRFQECRPKVDLLRRLEKESAKIEPDALVAMSNSSDPYPPMERELRLSRGCLQILKRMDCRVQVVTKSDLVAEDADLLAGMRATVAVTVTTLKDSICRKLEPGAPLPGKRLDAITTLADLGIPVSARVDPIIPGINDSEIEDLVRAVVQAGARHIVSSTYKARPGNVKRISSAFPDAGAVLKMLLRKGSRESGSLILPRELRCSLMQKVKDYASKMGVANSTCREGFPSVPGTNCDGSHLLQSLHSRDSCITK